MTKYLTALLLVTASPLLAGGEKRELHAHEHGVGEMNIAIEGTTVAMEIHAPGADIVGFEYEAETAEDRAKVDAAVAALAKPLSLFVLPEAAACTVKQAGAELEGHGDHAEFHAEYTLDCANPSAIDAITFAYFDMFPNALEVEVQMITPNGAQAFEVERDEPVLSLRGML